MASEIRITATLWRAFQAVVNELNLNTIILVATFYWNRSCLQLSCRL